MLSLRWWSRARLKRRGNGRVDGRGGDPGQKEDEEVLGGGALLPTTKMSSG
jgi:hypothetical protein